MKTHMTVPIFIPHLGCTHACVFCSQRSVTNIQAAPSPESVAFSVGEVLKTQGEKKAEIAFFGGSFTGIPRAEQEAYLKAVQGFLISGAAESIRISTRPDCIDDETVDFLKDYGVKTVELGAQSMKDHVLLKSGRGHTAEDTKRAADCIARKGLTLGLQMMTGLPGSTRDDEVFTAQEFVALGARIARIYPTVVFYDTPLYTLFKEGKYTPPSMEDTVERAAAALSVLEAGGVRVIRIGLQETETLGQKAAAGAYHPAMGEMVRAGVWRARLEKALCGFCGGDITVFCEKKLASQVVGQKKANFLYLAEKYGVNLTLQPAEEGCFLAQGDKRVRVSEKGAKHD